jgi:translocation and assembly module TamA
MRGFRLAGRLSPELSLQSGTFGYARARSTAASITRSAAA